MIWKGYKRAENGQALPSTSTWSELAGFFVNIGKMAQTNLTNSENRVPCFNSRPVFPAHKHTYLVGRGGKQIGAPLIWVQLLQLPKAKGVLISLCLWQCTIKIRKLFVPLRVRCHSTRCFLLSISRWKRNGTFIQSHLHGFFFLCAMKLELQIPPALPACKYPLPPFKSAKPTTRALPQAFLFFLFFPSPIDTCLSLHFTTCTIYAEVAIFLIKSGTLKFSSPGFSESPMQSFEYLTIQYPPSNVRTCTHS